MRTNPVQGEVSGPPDTGAIIRAAKLKNWIGALPYASPGAVLHRLDEELTLLNAATVKPSVRFELLELHAGAYARLLGLLSHRQGARGVAALKQHRAFAETARSVALRMADGYSLVVDGTALKKSLLFPNRGSGAAAIQRAVLFLCYSLNHYYDQYLPTEARVWISLANLYRSASQLGAIDQRGSPSDHRREFGKSVSHLYKLALLTGLTDPYRHGPGEVWMMFDFLGECADAATLGPEPPSAGPEGVFAIDPDGVERARALEPAADGEVATGLYLDTRPTSGCLRNRRDETDKDCRDAFPTARSKQQFVSILDRAIRCLETPAERYDDRRSATTRVQLAVGITATQCLIGGLAGAGTKATFNAGPDLAVQSVESGSDSEPKNDRVEQLQMVDPRSGGTVDVGVDFDTGERGIGWKEDDGADESDHGSGMADYGTELWQVIDKSRRGIGIMRHNAPQTPLWVGEIVSFVIKAGARAIGLVRWLTVDETGTYRAGIEIIGKRADPVSLRAAEDEANPGVEQPALALPFFGADEKVATLAALPGTFSEGGVLIVESPGTEVQVRIEMNSLIDATPSCERFSYRITRPNN